MTEIVIDLANLKLTSEEFEEVNIDSRSMFVARLGNDIEAQFKVKDILALLNDCDMLANQSIFSKRHTTIIQTDFSEGMQHEPKTES